MADTRTQRDVEKWVREQWMPRRYGQCFVRQWIKLASGGFHECDAVSADGKIIAGIATSGARTSSGKRAAGKFAKIRSDIGFLASGDAQVRLIVLTEKDMHEACLRDRQRGRVPANVDFALVELPPDLRSRLEEARKSASKEGTTRQ